MHVSCVEGRHDDCPDSKRDTGSCSCPHHLGQRTEREAAIERERVEQVFGLTGGELSDEPWVYWTQQESDVDGKPLYGPESGHVGLWEGHAVESHRDGFMEWSGRYWYDGAPEYAERELQETLGFYATVQTLVNPGGILSAPHRELYDGEGVWRLVETFSNSGEASCPFKDWDPARNTGVTSNDRVVTQAEADGYDGESCPMCEEKVGDEHGYIYFGVCSYEAVYVLVEQTRDEDEEEEGR